MTETIVDEIVPARAPWSKVVRAGDFLTIIDLHGNQAVDTLFYAVDGDRVDPAGRYSAQTTVAAQRNIFLTTGSILSWQVFCSLRFGSSGYGNKYRCHGSVGIAFHCCAQSVHGNRFDSNFLVEQW